MVLPVPVQMMELLLIVAAGTPLTKTEEVAVPTQPPDPVTVTVN